LKNKNKLYPYKKLSVFYNSCLKTFGSHLVVAFNCENPTEGRYSVQANCRGLNVRVHKDSTASYRVPITSDAR